MIDLCLVELPNDALDHPKMYFGLGNLYLAAAVQKAGFNVQICDFREKIGELPDAKFYGFSATTPQIVYAKELAKKVPGIGKTIIGGPHASLMPDDCMDDFDYIVKGEGEEVLVYILQGLMQPGIIITSRIQNLDGLPLPAWDLVDEPFSKTMYSGERYGEGELSVNIITSRGCPYDCYFCGNVFRKPVIYRSVLSIIDEIQELQKRGVGYYRFVDDNFTLHPQFDSLCVNLGALEAHYRCHTRSNLITANKARWLKVSGCDECSLGIESADDKVLKLSGKNETVTLHKKASRIIQDAGLKLKAYWMSGLPGETNRTLELNKEFVREIHPDKWTFSTFVPYPGCEMYNHPEKFGIKLLNTSWDRWWNFSTEFNHVINGQTIEQMWKRYTDFYDFLIKEG